jgi:MoxR-like ATPase
VQLPPPPLANDALTSDATPTATAAAADARPAAPPTANAAELGARLVSAIDAVVAGQHAVAEIAVATLFARGHLLIEDIPGVGKTLLAQVLARAVGGTFGRIQGTPDLLPGDVTGSMMPISDAAGSTRLEFRPGPVFANVVVFDELNRATPRTQSALLEAAEEATVTVDGTSHRLPSPFMLVATQNPIEIAGTYGLGEGSLDRFAAVVTPGRASAEFELDVVTGRRGRTMLRAIDPLTTPDVIAVVQDEVASVQVSDAVGEYVVALLGATRQHPAVRLGASTRAGVSLVGLARARAALSGRTYVVPDDVARVAVASLAHRILVMESGGSTTAGRQAIEECLAAVPVPTA